MQFLKKGSQGSAVKELQNILNELDYPTAVTGVFDTSTYNAVRNFQSSHLDKHNVPLVVDGKVGDLTWWSLQNPRKKVTTGAINYSIMPDASYGGSATGRAALQIAINELKAGAGEEGGNNKGPWVRKYLKPTGLSEGNPWCAGFVSWCFLQAAGGDRNAMAFKYTAGARNVYDQLKSKGVTFSGNDPKMLPQPGDIITWWRVSKSSGSGHIGIVHHFQDGFLYTIEGNRGANVAGFDYKKLIMDRLIGYARVK